MTENPLKAAARAVMATSLSRSGSHPAPDELVSYHAGQLDDDEREQILRHLAICPECARAALDIANFPDVELAAVPRAPAR